MDGDFFLVEPSLFRYNNNTRILILIYIDDYYIVNIDF